MRFSVSTISYVTTELVMSDIMIHAFSICFKTWERE